MKKTYWIILSLIILLIIIQFFPVRRSNPVTEGEIDVPVPVKNIIQRSCYDCHSNKTIWRWYSYVAPVSWLVTRDVMEGRDHLNFSEWKTYKSKKKNKLIEEIVEETEEGDMPLKIYLFIHRDAKLSSRDVATLKNWFGARKKKAEGIQ